MKTLKKTLVLATLILGMLMSFANEKINKGDKILVSNETGEIIYTGQLNHTVDIKHLFDFSQLNDGKYTIEVNKDFEIEINTIEVKNHKVKFLEDSRKVFKPVFKFENAKVSISKITFDNKNIAVELYFENELIHSEKVKNKNAVAKRTYKLDETKEGSYKAIVRADNREFIQYFKIK